MNKDAPIDIHITVNTEDGSVETNATQLSSELRRDINVMVDKRMRLHKRDGGSLR